MIKNAWRALLLSIPALSLIACDAREVEDGRKILVLDEIAPNDSPCGPEVFEGIAFTHCAADPEQHAIRLVHRDDNGAPYGTLAAYASARAADAPPVAFALNGGIMAEGGSPLGYYVEKGDRLQPLNRAALGGEVLPGPSGVFYGISTGDWAIAETERFYANVRQRPDFGTQSTPILLEDGELNAQISNAPAQLTVASGVGTDLSGRAHFVISQEPVSLECLARYFRDVLNVSDALYLDGNRSQLWDPARDRLDSGELLGAMIIVEIRENGE